jgi:hypothetical protein
MLLHAIHADKVFAEWTLKTLRLPIPNNDEVVSQPVTAWAAGRILVKTGLRVPQIIKTAERLQNVKGATEGDIMLLHAIHADKVFAESGVKSRIIIKSPDTDVLILCVHYFSKLQHTQRCVWFMIRARRLNLEETAISSTCVRLIARPVVQHTCIINPKIFNIRNRMYYSKTHTISSCFQYAVPQVLL